MNDKPFENYLGGKGSAGTYQKIINQIPPHTTLLIPFAGNCAVTRNIKPAANTLLLDKSKTVCNAWQNFITTHHLKNITIVKRCGIEWLQQMHKHYDNENTVIYCDPPYLVSTRTAASTKYEWDLTEMQHLELLATLKKYAAAKILISAYPNKIYKNELQHWQHIKYFSQTRKGKRLEILYFNFINPSQVLHDYKFAGNNYRQREAIKKKTNRYLEKFLNMNQLQRNIIIDQLLNQSLIITAPPELVIGSRELIPPEMVIGSRTTKTGGIISTINQIQSE